MNLNKKIISTIGLFICIAIIYIILLPYGYKSGQAGPGFEYLGTYWSENKYSNFESFMYHITPGSLFSLFIVIFIFRKSTLIKYVFTFIILNLLYLVIYIAGLMSLGLMNIFTGGIGILIINELLPQKIAMKKIYIFLIGITMGLIGLICTYHYSEPGNTSKNGLTILIAVLPWQLVTGLLFIFMPKRKDNKHNKYLTKKII